MPALGRTYWAIMPALGHAYWACIMTVLFSIMPAQFVYYGNMNSQVIMLKCHAALGPPANMPALERLMPPSGCLDLRSTAALGRHEALSGRAYFQGSLDQPCHFVPLLV